MSEFVRKDEFFRLGIEETGEEYMVNAKYDRVDYFPKVGAWILKLWDDKQGLIALYMGEETAKRVLDYTELPVVPRDWMYESEHDAWVESCAKQLSDEMFGGFNETFDDGEPL